jgi:hypothetical protein
VREKLMFDRLTWRGRRGKRCLLDPDDEEGDFGNEMRDSRADLEGQGRQAYIDDYDTPMGELARIADDVEAGRIELPPRWKLDRPGADVQIWTTPSGRRYACDPSGELLSLPDDGAAFSSPTSHYRRRPRAVRVPPPRRRP